jgi:hypothetical protein
MALLAHCACLVSWRSPPRCVGSAQRREMECQGHGKSRGARTSPATLRPVRHPTTLMRHRAAGGVERQAGKWELRDSRYCGGRARRAIRSACRSAPQPAATFRTWRPSHIWRNAAVPRHYTRTLVVNGKPAPVFGLLAGQKTWHHALARRALSRRSHQSGRHAYHHPLARPIAALERGRLSLDANAADPCR